MDGILPIFDSKAALLRIAVRCRRYLLSAVLPALFGCGTSSASPENSGPKSGVPLVVDSLISAPAVNRGLSAGTLVSRAIQSGQESLDSMRTLTCRQKVEISEEGRFKTSVESDINLNNGSEHYSNFTREGHSLAIPFKEATGSATDILDYLDYIGAPWSIGEYAGFLREALFQMKNFGRRGKVRTDGLSSQLEIYFDKVHWPLEYFEKHSYDIPHTVTVFIDPITAKILRIVFAFPQDSGLCANLRYVDYGFVSVGRQQYWVPRSGSFQSAGRDSGFFNNTITFDEYKKFSVESQVLFPR